MLLPGATTTTTAAATCAVTSASPLWMEVDGAKMDVKAYLDRLGNPDTKSLDSIVQAHLATIPFENCDTYGGGRRISLSVADAYEKVISHKRGGFCFEVNLLLGWILRRLGYDARYVAARVYRGKQATSSFVEDADDIMCPQCPDWDSDSPPTHIVVLVDGRWLCDVGFGEPPRIALDVTTEREQCDGQHRHKFVDGKFKTLLRQSRGAPGLNRIVSSPGVWESRILFDDNTERPGRQFLSGLDRVQTDDTVIFRQFLMCVAQTDAEKIVLTGQKLKITPFYSQPDQIFENIDSVETLYESSEALKNALVQTFGLSLENSTEAECVERAVNRVFSSS